MIPSLLTALFLILPGILLLPYAPLGPKLHPTEKSLALLGVSCAYWILGYWMTSLLPVSRIFFLVLSYGAFFTIAYLYRRRYAEYIRHAHGAATAQQIGIFLFVILLCLPQLAIALQIPVPSGIDMSMHTYIARIIFDARAFPQTMEPLLPVRQFGIYPFGFSALVALLATVNRLPLHTDALLFAVFSHVLLDISVYLVLRKRYPVLVSAAITMIVLWVSQNPHMFMIWGANPTVLSLALLFLSVALFPAKPDIGTSMISFLLLYASFLINYMPAIAAAYVGLVFSPWLLRPLRRICRQRGFPLMAIGCLLITMPFIIRLGMSGFTVTAQIAEFTRTFRTEELSDWTGLLDWSVFPFMIRHFSDTFHPYLIAIYGVCLMWMGINDRKMLAVHLGILVCIMFLIVNARFGWIPFSSVLYPLRISILIIIPMAYAFCELLVRGEKRIGHTRYRTAYASAAILMLVLLFARENIVGRYIRLTVGHAVVTRPDLRAFAWLTTHSDTGDIILNDYDDAGLWIPAIAGRRITTVQTNPVDFISVRSATRIHPTFAYIGTSNADMTIESLLSTAADTAGDDYALAYAEDGVRIYRIFPEAKRLPVPTPNK